MSKEASEDEGNGDEPAPRRRKVNVSTTQVVGGSSIAVALAGAVTAYLQAQSASGATREEAAASKARSEALYDVMRTELETARGDIKALKQEARRLRDALHAIELEQVVTSSGPKPVRRAAPQRTRMVPPESESQPTPDFVMMGDESPPPPLPEPEPEPARLPVDLDTLMEQKSAD